MGRSRNPQSITGLAAPRRRVRRRNGRSRNRLLGYPTRRILRLPFAFQQVSKPDNTKPCANLSSYYLSAWSVEKSLAIKDGVLTAGPGGAAASTPAMASGGASPTAAASSMASASAASSGASSAGAAGATGTSSAGAAGATGVMAMGAVAGIIGAAAALL